MVRLVGYISEVKDDSFVVTDVKTKEPTAVAYGDVAQMKGHNLSTGAKIGIGMAIGAGLTILLLYLYQRLWIQPAQKSDLRRLTRQWSVIAEPARVRC